MQFLSGRSQAVQQAITTPAGRAAAAKCLRELAEEIKATGLVANAIEKNGLRGVTVAAKTP